MSTNAMIDHLCNTVSKSKVEQYYSALFLEMQLNAEAAKQGSWAGASKSSLQHNSHSPGESRHSPTYKEQGHFENKNARSSTRQAVQATNIRAKIPDLPVGPQDFALRQESAEIAGIDVNQLPEAKLLKGVVRWIFELLDDHRTGKITAAKLIRVCEIYDDRVPVEGIRDTLAAVDGHNSLTERELYHWVVLMFGDCSEEEFFSGANEFGAAATKDQERYH